MASRESEAELVALHKEVMSCVKCELHKERRKAVPGEGPPSATVILVGEGPGEKEDEQGRPFVGAAGKLLTELLESVHLDRSQVFITNIVKCRPPNNRPPRKAEVEACNPYLEAQVRLIAPGIICPLGTPAIKTLMGPEYVASQVHGKPFRKDQTVFLPMFHPAAALYDSSLKEAMLQDFKTLRDLVDGKMSEAITALLSQKEGRKKGTTTNKAQGLDSLITVAILRDLASRGLGTILRLVDAEHRLQLCLEALAQVPLGLTSLDHAGPGEPVNHVVKLAHAHPPLGNPSLPRPNRQPCRLGLLDLTPE